MNTRTRICAVFVGSLIAPFALAQRVTSEDRGFEGYDYGNSDFSISGLLTLGLLIVGFVVSKTLRILVLGYIAFLAAAISGFWFLWSLKLDKWIIGSIALAMILLYPKFERYMTRFQLKNKD